MKRFTIFLLLLSASLHLRAQSPDSLWNEANTAYIDGSYGRAIALYDSILAGGQVSAKLYYNLAGAHFKSGHVGASILYYRRAERLAPTDPDIAHNLQVAGTMVKDRIEPLPEFFAARWVRALRTGLSSNSWALVALILFALAGASVLVYLLAGRLRYRKAGFWAGLACGALLVVALSFSWVARRETLHPRDGVVMRMNVAVKSSPDAGAKELYIINEGTEVRVVGELQQWREVTLADGKKGWIEASAIEMI